MKHFKTPKGTELPMLDMRGKDYLQVAHRLVWFREEKPLWAIETEIVSHDEKKSICRASIKDDAGRTVATATKQEDAQGFKDHLEKAETGAIGRALALVGYGTQFAPDLDEAERVVDSPLARGNSMANGRPQDVAKVAEVASGGYVIKISKKLKGKRLEECDVYELADFSKWLSEQPDLAGVGLETRDAIEAYLKTRETVRAK